jgi:uroporphyrinogen III methyltransferase/synthase
LLQVEEAFSFFPKLDCRLTAVDSCGDKNKHISLLDAGGDGGNGVPPDFFTRELDELLIRGEADVAVHSAKDLPYPLPPELDVYALLEAADRTDALVSRDNLPLDGLPAGARVGTSSPTRRDELLRRRPDLQIVSIRGTVGERLAQVDSGAVDALVVATCALKRLGESCRMAETLPFRTHPLQGHLALVGRKDRPELGALFCDRDIRRQYGRVTLVGFGPGHRDLLTIGGDRALAEADAIFHDELIDHACLSRYPGEKINVGKRKGHHRFHQDEINEQVYRAAIAGRTTVRLKGGDPMIFARGREEIDFLQRRLVAVHVVPGVSAGIAAAACTHIPLTHRGRASSVAFVSGHAGLQAPAPNADTLVYYMGGAHVAAVAGRLIAAGRSRELPVALVSNVSMPDQKVCFSTLGELQYSAVHCPTPILILVGETVAFESGAARTQPVLVTGTSAGTHDPDANVTHTPLIEIGRIADSGPLYDAVRALDTFQWVVFTSRYGVRYFFEAFHRMQSDVRMLAPLRFASVGKTTAAELRKHGIRPDLQPDDESAEGLVRAFAAAGEPAQRILLPRSDRAVKYLPEALAGMGHDVTEAPAYSNRVNAAAKAADLSGYRKIIFASPSGVDAFIRLYGALPSGILPSGIQLVAKGKTTAEKLKSELYETI